MLKTLREYIVESLVDARAAFNKKRGKDFLKKMTDLQRSMSNVFKRQEDQERYATDLFDSLSDIVEERISQKRFRLACPAAFDAEDGWPQDTNVLDVISFAYPQSRSGDWQQIQNYVRLNSDVFTKLIKDLKNREQEIIQELDSLEWPAPWRRYTKYGEVSANLHRFIDNVNKMLS